MCKDESYPQYLERERRSNNQVPQAQGYILLLNCLDL